MLHHSQVLSCRPIMVGFARRDTLYSTGEVAFRETGRVHRANNARISTRLRIRLIQRPQFGKNRRLLLLHAIARSFSKGLCAPNCLLKALFMRKMA